MTEQCQSLASQARARLSSKSSPKDEKEAPSCTIQPKRQLLKSTARFVTSKHSQVTTSSSHRKLPPQSSRHCPPVTDADAVICSAEQSPSVLSVESSIGQIPSEGSLFEDETVESTGLSPIAITDAALLKSQMLLEHLSSLDLSDEESRVAGSPSAASTKPSEDTEDVCRSTQLADLTTTVQVPVKFMEMLGEMWEQIQADRERVEQVAKCSSARSNLDKRCADLDENSSRSTALSPSSSLSSPDCSTPASSPGSSARSLGSPVQYCVLSAADKAELIQDVKEAIRAKSPSKAAAPPSVLGPCVVSAAIPAAASARQIQAMPSSRCVSVVPAQVGAVVPSGRFSWQPVAVTTVHHVLTAR